MGGSKVRAWHAGLLPWVVCTALALVSHGAIGSRLLHSSGSVQPGWEQGSRFRLQPRRLAEVEAAGEAGEGSAQRGFKHMVLGGGINRLGIHGEGLGFAHALLESDAEVMALAAAMRSGDVYAEGHGLKKAGDDGETEAEYDSAGSPAADDAARKSNRLKKVAEKLAEAARSRDGPAGDGEAEGTSAADTTEEPSQAAAPDRVPAAAAAAGREQPAGREADALPPWFSRKTASTVVEAAKKPAEHSHGAGRHMNRRSRHNRCLFLHFASGSILQRFKLCSLRTTTRISAVWLHTAQIAQMGLSSDEQRQ